MIRLDTTTCALECLLGAAVSANQPQVYVTFVDKPAQQKTDFSDYRGGKKQTTCNGTVAISACAAPLQVGTVRDVDYVNFFNADTATVVATFRINDNSTYTTLVKKSLNPDTALIYESGAGWLTI